MKVISGILVMVLTFLPILSPVAIYKIIRTDEMLRDENGYKIDPSKIDSKKLSRIRKQQYLWTTILVLALIGPILAFTSSSL